MVLGGFDRSVTFDPSEAARAIFGRGMDENISQFLGEKDLRKGTMIDEGLAEIRAGKYYNSFGKTRKIDF